MPPTVALALLLFPNLAQESQASAPASQPAAWNIEDPHGPFETVKLSVDEATWISADVRPDGKQLVFSILGDLYLLPIEGGEAKRITSGPAYDVQPRFSPDGMRIAFASDRGGLENLWVCDLEGKELKQVSTEKNSIVNSPAWSPDGDYLVGRVRLTDRSSLGTTELRLWHVRGGQGMQLTSKDDQPEVADPVFSRDGRFVYFSARDARYRYGRNVNEGIWQIKRLDRRSGQVVDLTGEFGGAAAPSLSPDGKQLSFIRRVRAKTLLEVMNLETGAVRALASDLERDMQEGFAFHGVFPGTAWTGDGRAIVASSEGKLWRYDVATGERSLIPFRADVEQRITEAVRFPHSLGEDSVRARLIRWPVESPDGKRLVFVAFGHLYAMDLPSGEPRRLTTLVDPESSPAFSRDGKQLAFVTWSDRAGGHVWTLPMDGAPPSAPKRITEHPAQYANPSFSPDGSRLVFLRGSGATFRDEDLASELWHEIRWTEAAGGGAARYVTGVKNRGVNRRMPRPTFSADGERIWFVEDEPNAKPSTPPKTVLASVKLDGTDKRAHLRWERAEEASVSPDDRWVAFTELHNAYVTALPETGKRTVDVNLEDAPLPLAQLSDEGGDGVGWADGGKTITWIFGPTYRRLPLERALPQSAAESRPAKSLPKSDPIEIRLAMPRAKPTGTTAYVGARIVTMRGDEVLENGTVIVDGDRIRAVGPTETITVPPGATTVELRGKTVIPGLFDEHAHLHYSALDILPQQPWKYLANLAYGVTSTHDPSASTHEVFCQSEMVEAGLMKGPRIFSTGYILYGADDPSRALIKSLDDARKHLRRLKTLGAFTVKSYMQPKREQRQWILQAAREEGMMVVPEGGGDLEMDLTMVLDGHTTIEHSLPVTPLRKDVLTLFGKSKTAYTPTLLVAYGGLFGDLWYYQHDEVWQNEKLLRFVPQGVVDRVARIRSVMATDEDWHHIDVAASAKKLLDAGASVCLGAHGQMQGLGPHWELRTMVRGGMTPHEALRAGTLAPARALGLDRDLGSIEPGKLADFVVLDRNPIEKIEHAESTALVVKNGVAYRPEELERKK